jgi:uncharacterized protein
MTVAARISDAAPLRRVLKYAEAPFAGLETAQGEFTGYASVFGRVDLGNDRVAAGAFKKALAARGPRGVRMLFQHDPNEVIGTWQDIREDDTGLFVKGRLNVAVARGREVLELIRAGAIDGLSIGFKTVDAVRDRPGGVRTILEADLWEISVVTFPMLPEARVREVKGGNGASRPLPSIRDFERWLTRDAGLTRSDARGVIAEGFLATKRARDAALKQADPEGAPKTLAALIRSAARKLNPEGMN